jgi:hypothetical protein
MAPPEPVPSETADPAAGDAGDLPEFLQRALRAARAAAAAERARLEAVERQERERAFDRFVRALASVHGLIVNDTICCSTRALIEDLARRHGLNADRAVYDARRGHWTLALDGGVILNAVQSSERQVEVVLPAGLPGGPARPVVASLAQLGQLIEERLSRAEARHAFEEANADDQ